METYTRAYVLQNGKNFSPASSSRRNLHCAKTDEKHSRAKAVIKQFIDVFNGVMEKK